MFDFFKDKNKVTQFSMTVNMFCVCDKSMVYIIVILVHSCNVCNIIYVMSAVGLIKSAPICLND